ncbi:unnamed protein product [Cuscuta campestris]|uniref:Uncharacterized protein n=1 Tax=Cuscuta campestris TaxID=132261 RepID=A0A484MFV3_9ASTE|nr:unnamed protein product [Cuscuta campestris]
MATWPLNTRPALPGTAASTAASAAGGSSISRCCPSVSFPYPLCHRAKSLLLLPPPQFHRSFHRPAANRTDRSFRCSSGSPRPQPDPPDRGKSSSGAEEIVSKVQNRVQIFFAVLFWMSLFFWYSIWDGRNDGRPTKSSRFRR